MCKYWILVLLAVTAYLGKEAILGEGLLQGGLGDNGNVLQQLSQRNQGFHRNIVNILSIPVQMCEILHIKMKIKFCLQHGNIEST
jgi:hypothetical protein